MRSFTTRYLILRISGIAVLLAVAAPPARAEEVRVSPKGSAGSPSSPDLASAVTGAAPGTVIRLERGTYDLTPAPYVEYTCGNCEVESTRVEATVGLRVSGEGIRIQGPEGGDAVIRTHAGYGILFEDCMDCALSGITLTGGVRDTSENATDAAVVVKRSRVTVENCRILENIGDSTVVAKTVVGIMGIAGRDGSLLTARGNRITRNSWDGVALYRGASAIIEGNLIDGVDLARGSHVGGGRGVGIGATWDAAAKIRGNLVRRYWKGIGAFVDAQVVVEENVVEHVATWGLTLWDAGRGRPSGFFSNNVVYDTGACGVSVIRERGDPPFPGRFVGNVLVKTGQDPRYDSGEPYCFQEPIARHAVPDSFVIEQNLLYSNRTAGDRPAPGDVEERVFRERLVTVRARHEKWPVLKESDFWKGFAGGR